MLHYSTYSLAWVFAYRLTPAVNLPEKLASVQYVAPSPNNRGTHRSSLMLIGL